MGKDTPYSPKERSTKIAFQLFNIYASNIRVLTFVKETISQLKSHIDPHTMIVGDFNGPLSQMGRASRKT